MLHCSPPKLRSGGETGSESLPCLQSACLRSQVWALPSHAVPLSLHFHSALLHRLQVSQVTGDGSQGPDVKPISSSALTALEAQPVLAASFTSLGDFQGNSSMLI